MQQFFYISCLRALITNRSANCLKGELAGSDAAIHIQNYRLFWRILIKSDLTTGEASLDGSLTIANDDLEPIRALLMANNSHW